MRSRSQLWVMLIVAFINVSLAGVSAAQTSNERDIKRIYKRLIDAEDKHDLTAVRALIWNSPSTLFVAKAPLGWQGH
jgi:hypothetical protein